MSLIEVNNLTKVYSDEGGGKTIALGGVSFKIEKGEFVSIMGPSGSGKSTLLQILGFLDQHTAGSYVFENKNADNYTDDELAEIRNKKLGFIFQAFNLLPKTTVLQNTQLPLLYSNIPEREWEGRATRAIEAVGLMHRISHETGMLSGGEKQRAAIARALVLDPEVIFADEPTGNLDSKSGQMVMETIQGLNENHGHTIILITHETATAEHAHRIIRIKDGLVESDAPVLNRLAATSAFTK